MQELDAWASYTDPGQHCRTWDHSEKRKGNYLLRVVAGDPERGDMLKVAVRRRDNSLPDEFTGWLSLDELDMERMVFDKSPLQSGDRIIYVRSHNVPRGQPGHFWRVDVDSRSSEGGTAIVVLHRIGPDFPVGR